MIATRYPCAFAGTALSLALLLGSAQVATAQSANNSAAVEQALQQMVTLFPSMSPQSFIHLQNAFNQMLQTMPNDPFFNTTGRLHKAPGISRNLTTPVQNASPVNTGFQQNSLFPGRPGFIQNTPGVGPNQVSRPNNHTNIQQNQFANVNQNQVGKCNCQKNLPSVGAANANAFGQPQAALARQQAGQAQQQATAATQQHHHHHHHNIFASQHHHKK